MTGTMEELLQWAERDHHVDLSNRELVVTLADVITNGAWRNNSRSRIRAVTQSWCGPVHDEIHPA